MRYLCSLIWEKFFVHAWKESGLQTTQYGQIDILHRENGGLAFGISKAIVAVGTIPL